MKEIMKKIADKLKLIFGYSIMITLFVGGLTFFGYLVALIIGGDIATAICVFIYKKIIPVMIYVSTVTVLLGLLAMYLAGEKSLTPSKRNKKV
jgi:hypothetical protein